MASVPCCTFSAGRVHTELAMQRQKSSVENDRTLADLLRNHGQPPVFFACPGKSGHMNPTATSNESSSKATHLPSPSVLIRSDSGVIDPSTLTQAKLKPVPSQSTPGIGPRKG